MAPAEALALVEDAERQLWGPSGAKALAFLTGPRRALTHESIRRARLGWLPCATARTRDGRPYRVEGIVIPWFEGETPVLVKFRQPEGRRPKYAEVFRNPDHPPRLYPGPAIIRPGRALVLPEGEFDALLLGQLIGDLAAVATLGSASARPAANILRMLLIADPWFIATDGDDAGDKSAASWPPSARRVRPPGGLKDWCEANAAGIDLRRWWERVLAGEPDPRLSWDELMAVAALDPYTAAEREAIQAESRMPVYGS
jgi:hypothetical protein